MSEEVQNNETNEEVAEESAAPAEESFALSTVFGFKKGMSAIYNEAGERVPVTVLECKPWTVTQIKTKETDGYDSVQIAYAAKKAKNSSKAQNGHAKKAGSETGFKFYKEVRGEAPEGLVLGKQVGLDSLEVGKKVQITSKSKGRGFAGAMKRYGFGGGPASHGSGFHRKPGSIGMCEFPGRVMPGKKMPGHYGNANITVKGVEVVGVDVEENVVLLKGAVPGPVNGMVKIAAKN